MRFASAIICILFTISNSAFSAPSTVLNFHVRLITKPCVVDGETVMNVDLGKISKADLSSAPWTDFSVLLKDCPTEATSVGLAFSGETDGTANEYIKNTSTTGRADNTAIEVKDSDDDTRITSGSEITRTLDSNHATKFNMKARIVPLAGKTTGGTVTGRVEFTIVYP
ncbi:TPA: fimbrial protein [Enterobacter ludwigii]